MNAVSRDNASRQESPPKVLIVDPTVDPGEIPTDFSQAVERVTVVSTAEEALEGLRAVDVDCVVSEYDLPTGTGIDLLTHVREESSSMSFLLWTDNGDERTASEAIAAGVSDYIIKPEGGPLDWERLASRIEDVIGTRDGGKTVESSVLCDLSRGLAEAQTLEEGLEIVLASVCKVFPWRYSEVWIPDEQRDELVHVDSYGEHSDRSPFIDESRSTTFEAGEGIPGHVWASETVEWINDIGERSLHRSSRVEAMKRAGFESALGIPVAVDGRVKAVVIYYLRTDRAGVNSLRDQTESVTQNLGELIGEKMAEPSFEVGRERVLQERVKELTAIQRTVDLFGTSEDLVTDLLDEFIETLPEAFQYPSVAEARITYEGFETETDGFEPSDDRLTVKACLSNEASVHIEVLYTDDRPREDYGPFLAEERELLTVMTTVIEGYIKRREFIHETEAARRRYQALVEAAPDPIFVADADTGEIIEVNSAAASLRKQPGDDIVGLHQTDLHPDRKDNRYGDMLAPYEHVVDTAVEYDRYQEVFARSSDEGKTISQFDDGTPVYLETSDGRQIPVAISTKTVTIDGQDLSHRIYRDISDRKQYEESLEGINTAARELLQAETDTEIARTIVDTGTTIMDAPIVGIYLFNQQSGTLTPTACSEEFEAIFGEPPHFSPGENLFWEVFSGQKKRMLGDVRPTEYVYAAGTPIRSTLVLPLDEYGVFLIGDTHVDGLDELTVEIWEILAATAKTALKRADRTQALRERERELQMQTQRLERVHQLNEKIRKITQSLVSASSREPIEQAVCDALITVDKFDYAWIGEPDLTKSEVDLRSQAGSGDRYLEEIPLTIDETDSPAVTTIRTRQTTVEPNIANHFQDEEWRDIALLHNFRSVISVPLVHDEILYGSLTIYSEQAKSFDNLSESVLTELGSLIGFALNAVEQQNALVEDDPVSLTLRIHNSNDVFAKLSSRFSTDVYIKNISTISSNKYLVHITAENIDPANVVDFVDDTAAIEAIQHISDSDPALFEVITRDEWIAPRISRLGANLQFVKISDRNCRLTVSIPRDRELKSFINQLRDRYPDADLEAKRKEAPNLSPPWEQLVDKNLTDRQREILTTAYYSGFFEDSRKRNGTEIANSLDISQPAFSKQLRAAQNKLFTSIFEN